MLSELNRQMTDLESMDITKDIEASDDEMPDLPIVDPNPPKLPPPPKVPVHESPASIVTYRITEKGKRRFELLGERQSETVDGKAFRQLMIPADWELQQILILAEDKPQSRADYIEALLCSLNNNGPQIHRDILNHLEELLSKAVNEELLEVLVDDSSDEDASEKAAKLQRSFEEKRPTVTIPIHEYERLQKAAYHLKLLQETSLARDNAPRIRECAHFGCHACCIHDGCRSPSIYHGCKNLFCCEDDCDTLPEEDDPYYCDQHAEIYLVREHCELGDSWICKDCLAHRRSEAEKKRQLDSIEASFYVANKEKIDALTEKDIELVMSNVGCSRQNAIQALVENGGDLVMAIMQLQSR